MLLSGTEQELRRRALRSIIEALGDDAIERSEIEAGGSKPTDWFAEASTAPLFAERRSVFVRRLLRADPKGLSAPKLPSTAFVVLVADEEFSDGDRNDESKRRQTAWEKLVRDSGGTVVDFAQETNKAEESIKREAARLEKKMSPKAISTLLEMTGSKISRSFEELEKVALYVGDRPEIRESDLLEVVVPAREWSVFALVEALVQGSTAEGMRQLRILTSGEGKPEDAAMRNILPMMSRMLRLLWQARGLIDARRSADDPSTGGLWAFPDKNNLLTEKPYSKSKSMRLARNLSLNQIAEMMAIVARTDSQLKGLADSFGPTDSLQRMAFEIAAVASVS